VLVYVGSGVCVRIKALEAKAGQDFVYNEADYQRTVFASEAVCQESVANASTKFDSAMEVNHGVDEPCFDI
jgi:hypothetical protein